MDGRGLSLSSSSSDKYETRVTEYVKSNTSVTGDGTLSNPWEFENVNFATLTTNNKEIAYFYNGTETDNSNEKSVTKQVAISNGTAIFEINVKKGYKNDPSDGCGLKKQSNVQNYSKTDKITYKVEGLTSDYSCLAKFVVDEFSILYDLAGGSLGN